MLEETFVPTAGQLNRSELALLPTHSDVMGLDPTFGEHDQAMSTEPRLDMAHAVDTSIPSDPSFSLLDPLNSSELFATVPDSTSSTATETSSTSVNNTGSTDNLIGQAGVNLAHSTASSTSHQSVAGTLWADRFVADLNTALTVISGNGNVNYGAGYYDYLDLSNYDSSVVTNSGQQVFDPGSGIRLMDSLTFANGAQVLFEGLDGIRFADQWIDLSVDPNDPYFSNQWNLHMMGVQNAWRFTKGTDDILLGVQDTGLGINAFGNFHPDLRDTTYFVNNVADDFVVHGASASNSHGTGVQGIMAATANNGIGTSGINWNSDVFHIDVLGGQWSDYSLAAAAQAMINQANSNGQKAVINMSLEGGLLEPAFEAVVAANQANALFVIASGNGNNSFISNPATLAQKYANVMAVGASWGLSDRSSFPTMPGQRIDYGFGDWGSNYGQGLSIMGPSEVWTTEAANTWSGVTFGTDTDFNGTSAAAPNVAGVASLVWSANPNLTATQVHQILAETAFDLGAPGDDLVYGAGFVNADAAVRRALVVPGQLSASSAMGSLSANGTLTSSAAISGTETVGMTAVEGMGFNEATMGEIEIANAPDLDRIDAASGGHRFGTITTEFTVSALPTTVDLDSVDQMESELLQSTPSLEMAAATFDASDDIFSNLQRSDWVDSDHAIAALTHELPLEAIAADWIELV
jgi:serine protease